MSGGGRTGAPGSGSDGAPRHREAMPRLREMRAVLGSLGRGVRGAPRGHWVGWVISRGEGAGCTWFAAGVPTAGDSTVSVMGEERLA